MMKVSVIITTYNRPEALQCVLEALFRQDRPAAEIIVADDGSTQETADCIAALAAHALCPIEHVWQPDQGFQAARARNRAVIAATGDYLIFLDGDCIPGCRFVSAHVQLARPARLVAGNRILLSQRLSRAVEFAGEDIWQWSPGKWLLARLRGDINRVLPLLSLSPAGAWRERWPGRWQGVKTCNLGVWKDDFVRVNGFDESYHGWGHEDADLAIRLNRAGVKRRDGRYAVPVLHLWHREHDRGREAENRGRLEQRIRSANRSFRAEKGLDQYL